MHTAFLLIGGNLGDRFANLQKACTFIEEECGDIIQLSSVYETAAWGLTEQPSFLNQVAVLQTELEPAELISNLLKIEADMGRVRVEKLGPRIIDIDILLMDQLVIDSPGLTIPHPAMHLRRFTLTPLAEVAANRLHPVLHKTIAELLTDCPDTLEVKKIS